MIAVIFEAWPEPDHLETYLDLAAALEPQLMVIDGFLSIERFESLSERGKLLSLSFWRDEDALLEWRNNDQHRAAQHEARTSIFRDYRLRLAAGWSRLRKRRSRSSTKRTHMFHASVIATTWPASIDT